MNKKYDLLLLNLICLFLIVGAGCKEASHPKDKVLADNFQQHEVDFDNLVVMLNQDSKVIRIADNFTWLDNNVSWPRSEHELGFSKERWDQYRSLFARLNLKEGIKRTEDAPGTIFFIASSRGLVTGGTDKGYAYSIKSIEPLVESLDRIRLDGKTERTIYKRIKGNWYLYYQAGG